MYSSQFIIKKFNKMRISFCVQCSSNNQSWHFFSLNLFSIFINSQMLIFSGLFLFFIKVSSCVLLFPILGLCSGSGTAPSPAGFRVFPNFLRVNIHKLFHAIQRQLCSECGLITHRPKKKKNFHITVIVFNYLNSFDYKNEWMVHSGAGGLVILFCF